MNLLVTADGIETEAERDPLERLDRDVMQGYRGSRPPYGAVDEQCSLCVADSSSRHTKASV